MKHGTRRLVLSATGIVLAAAAVSACSSGGSSGQSQGAGGHSLSDLKIGMFAPGTTNTYAADVTSSAGVEAKSLGVNLTTNNGNFDVQNQVNQMQQALQRKSYNAWIVVPLDPAQECSVIQQAVTAGIKVMMAVNPACTPTGPNGGLGIVAVQTQQLYNQWWDYILSHNNPGKIAVLEGGAVDYVTKFCNNGLAAALKSHPGFTVVSKQTLNYSTSAAYQNVQDVLHAHPDLSLVVSDYTGMTVGAVRAVQQSGNASSVKVYDMDGDHNAVKLIQNGQVEMTVPGLPKSESADAVKLVAQAWQGKSVPKVTNPLDSLNLPGAPFVTKANAAQFHPEY